MYPNLNGLMAKYSISQTNLSKILHISYSALSAKLTGKKDFKTSEVDILMKIFNEPYEYILSKEKPKLNYTISQL